LFAELKHQIGLRRLRLRRMKFVREQFFLAAAAQNIKRLVRFLSTPTPPLVLTAQKREEELGSTHPARTRSAPITEFFNSHACRFRACSPRNSMKISQSRAIIHDGGRRRD
jgi:hypothetical protein